VVRLRRVSCSGPGITRVRAEDGFRYVDAAGNAVDDPAVLQRISELVLPPAWEDVWICAIPNGHVQATGVDAKGRRQYRYHDAWRVQRDLAKHDRILEFAAQLPPPVSGSWPTCRRRPADPHPGAGLRRTAAGPRLLPHRRGAVRQ
jgi:DNA topoisomerase IB